MDRREELFWKKVNKNGKNGCWLWMNEMCGRMHGHVVYKGVRTTAHRISYMLTKGKIPEGMCVLHKCDNGRCVNPDHLFLGTQAENVADMIAKKRNYVLPVFRGENHGRSKVTDKQCKEIRRLYSTGKFSQWDLAHKFGIGQSQIGRIIRKENRSTA